MQLLSSYQLKSTITMNCVRNRLNYGLCFIVLVSCLLGSNEVIAQEQHPVVYKFSVDGIENRADAKILLHAFLQESFTVNSVFLIDCQCFKLSTKKPLNYTKIQEVVIQYGLELSEDVLCSDGSILHRPTDQPPIHK